MFASFTLARENPRLGPRKTKEAEIRELSQLVPAGFPPFLAPFLLLLLYISPPANGLLLPFLPQWLLPSGSVHVPATVPTTAASSPGLPSVGDRSSCESPPLDFHPWDKINAWSTYLVYMRSWADLKVPYLFGWQACEGEEDHGSWSVWLQRDHRGGVHDHVQQYGSESGKHLVKQTSSCLAMPFDLFIMRIFVKARTSDDCEGRILQRNCSKEQLNERPIIHL